MPRSPLAPRSPYAKPHGYDFGPSTWGPSGNPYNHGPNPYDDPVSTYDPTTTAESLKRRSGSLRGF